jgi:hypothetical protein
MNYSGGFASQRPQEGKDRGLAPLIPSPKVAQSKCRGQHGGLGPVFYAHTLSDFCSNFEVGRVSFLDSKNLLPYHPGAEGLP